jgi:excisionase family DNA binding protein
MTLTIEREYLTVAEAAVLWRVSAPTVYRHVAAGRVPHIRVGGRDGPIRIPASAVMGVPDDGSPVGGSFAGADPAGAPRTGRPTPPAVEPRAHAGPEQ